MDKKSRLFKATDILLIILAVLPIVFGMVLKVLINPPASDIEITGAKIYFTIQTPLMDLPISESQVNSWIVIISIFWLCLWLTHGIRCGRGGKRQLICEYIVEKAEGLVRDNGRIFLRLCSVYRGGNGDIGILQSADACRSLSADS